MGRETLRALTQTLGFACRGGVISKQPCASTEVLCPHLARGACARCVVLRTSGEAERGWQRGWGRSQQRGWGRSQQSRAGGAWQGRAPGKAAAPSTSPRPAWSVEPVGRALQPQPRALNGTCAARPASWGSGNTRPPAGWLKPEMHASHTGLSSGTHCGSRWLERTQPLGVTIPPKDVPKNVLQGKGLCSSAVAGGFQQGAAACLPCQPLSCRGPKPPRGWLGVSCQQADPPGAVLTCGSHSDLALCLLLLQFQLPLLLLCMGGLCPGVAGAPPSR